MMILSEAINSTSYASKAKEIDDALNNEVMSIDTLKFIINLKPPHLPKYVEKLLLLRTTSVLSILELPTCIEEVDNYSELSREQKMHLNRGPERSVCFFYNNLKYVCFIPITAIIEGNCPIAVQYTVWQTT